MASNPTNVAMTAANITKWVAWGGCFVNSIFGMNNQNTTLYIQLHQVPPKADGTLANGTVPIVKSLQVLANLPFIFSVNLPLQELLVAISTTEANYTAVGANGGLDMTVNVSSDYFTNGTEVVVGDTTTVPLGSKLQVWTEAAGLAQPFRLLRVTMTEQLGTKFNLAVGTTDAFAAANIMSSVWFPVAANATADAYFGSDGLDVWSQNASGVLSRGCTIYGFYANGGLNGAGYTTGASLSTFRAIYR